MTTYDLIF